MKVIIVNGFGGCGKDSFEEFFRKYVEEKGKTVVKTSMVDGVKILAERLGWGGRKEDKDRRFLADLKDILERWNDLPFTCVVNTIEEARAQNIDYLFIDAREGKDIDRIKEFVKDNVVTVLVDRKINHVYNNHADDNVLDYQYDWVIDNNGSLEDLEGAAATFYSNIEVYSYIEENIDIFQRN